MAAFSEKQSFLSFAGDDDYCEFVIVIAGADFSIP